MASRKVLVVGGGAREHALVWALRRSPSVGAIDAAPGNPGIGAIARNQPVAADDVPALVELARRERYDLVVVGPEKPLSLGLANALMDAGFAVFGCSRAASEIESSKAFAKAVMERAQVPTARWRTFGGSERDAAIRFAGELLAASPARRVVVKADGLAAGKGVIVAGDEPTLREAIGVLLAPGGLVVVEEFLVGREASCMALVDGERVLPLPPCEDHKTLLDGDLGPMTGGMGAMCPTPVVDGPLLARVEREVLLPTARRLAAEGRPFRGVLYAGLMVTADGPKVLEFNCRFGDPEAQSLLALVDGDLCEALLAAAEGRAPRLSFINMHACSVVLAAAGYPGAPIRGAEIRGVPEAEATGALVFHAGTRRDGDRLLVDGGRVLTVTATGAHAAEARARAYRAAAAIRFDGMQLRRDIGAR